MDDFSNAPQGIGEIRSDKTEKASDWTPRDVLVYLLRAIDSGDLPKVDALFVAYRYEGERGIKTARYCNSAPDITVALGTIETAKSHFIQDAFS